jgi:DNA polymerase alpha subunit B
MNYTIAALDDRIDEFAEIIQGFYNVEEFGDPAASTEVCSANSCTPVTNNYLVQEETTIVGRIVFDSDSTATAAVKLNKAILTLESSRSMGSGARVHLKFDPNVRLRGAKKGIGGVGLFPGAIVALRGKNGGGGWFTVTEVLPVCCRPRIYGSQLIRERRCHLCRLLTSRAAIRSQWLLLVVRLLRRRI